MHVLLIKMSSMGDVIHTLPALTDAMNAIPHLEIDWVVEPAFADIPAWHPAVKKIIPIALRHWRKNIFKQSTLSEIKTFYKTLREKKYDVIIDAQGLLKSAIVAKLAHGKIHGLDKQSAREPISSFFYAEKYNVNKNQHAVTRTRALFSKIFGYTFSGEANYQINPKQLPMINFEIEKKYFVFLHGTTWKTKHYPEMNWKKLIADAAQKNIPVYLPWGNEKEKNRAEKLATNNSNAHVLPTLSIAQLATVLKNASGVVAVDTGLGHLCAALSTPTISLYGPTDPNKVGALGQNQIHLRSQNPTANEVDIDPELIWKTAQGFLQE